MSPRSPLSPEVRAFLERERVIPPLGAAQRARAMARARSALAMPAVVPTAPSVAAPRTHWTAAAAAAVVLSAAVGAAAYEMRARLVSAPTTRPAPVSEVIASSPVLLAPAVPAGDIAPTPVPTVGAPGLSPVEEAARVELRLLRQARAAIARGDFTDALPPINEHTRRFKNGRFVEEREALRVKALWGLGRTEEARRAAIAFRARFPRSVLLPAVTQMSVSGP